jgi:hypothetical protein
MQCLNIVVQDTTCEWRLCVLLLFASSALSRKKRGGYRSQHQFTQSHHHSEKPATHSSTLEALGFIDPPSARFVLPPSAPSPLDSLRQRHPLLLRLHGLQRLPGRHAPQRHQQRERRRHQHNRPLELGCARRPLRDVAEHIVA